jgi:hypothetical protein
VIAEQKHFARDAEHGADEAQIEEDFSDGDMSDPDYNAYWEMADAAIVEADTIPDEEVNWVANLGGGPISMMIAYSPDTPVDQVWFRDKDGRVIGKIINIGPEVWHEQAEV